MRLDTIFEIGSHHKQIAIEPFWQDERFEPRKIRKVYVSRSHSQKRYKHEALENALKAFFSLGL